MVRVHPRAREKHPEIEEAGVIWTWENCFVEADREPGEIQLRLGFDRKGRKLEMVGR